MNGSMRTRLVHLAAGLALAAAAACADESEPHRRGLAEIQTRPDLGSPIGRFVLIPPGTGYIGGYHYLGDTDEFMTWMAEQFPEVYPNSWVTITRPFWLQSTEVTRAEWLELMPEHIAGRLLCDDACPAVGADNAFFRDDPSLPPDLNECEPTCPANFVSWIDAVYYADRRSRAEGRPACYDAEACGPWAPGELDAKQLRCLRSLRQNLDCEGYRLPGNYEWEYAARSGGAYQDTDPDFIFLESYPKPFTPVNCEWYNRESGWHFKPVAQKCETIWGAYDLASNVREVAWDRPHYYTAEEKVDPVLDPTPDDPLVWVVRGGDNGLGSGAAVDVRLFVWEVAGSVDGLRLVRTASCRELRDLDVEIPATMTARCAEENEGSGASSGSGEGSGG